MKHLWEEQHPYYMCEGNYYKAGCHTVWESLDDFLREFGDADVDYNLVIRWDWREGKDWGLPEYPGNDTERYADLMVQMLHQRKAQLWSHQIKVCRNDEPAARDYLQKHADRIAQNWFPILVEQSE